MIENKMKALESLCVYSNTAKKDLSRAAITLIPKGLGFQIKSSFCSKNLSSIQDVVKIWHAF